MTYIDRPCYCAADLFCAYCAENEKDAPMAPGFVPPPQVGPGVDRYGRRTFDGEVAPRFEMEDSA